MLLGVDCGLKMRQSLYTDDPNPYPSRELSLICISTRLMVTEVNTSERFLTS